jgi:predicted nucleotide-binding protein
MARRTAASLLPQPARLTPQAMKAGIERLQRRIEEVKKFDPQTVTEQYNIPERDRLSAAIDDALVRTFGSDTVEYNRYKDAASFDNGPHNYAYEVPIHDVRQSLNRSKASTLALLGQAVQSLEEQLGEEGALAAVVTAPEVTPKLDQSKIFVVHGHDEGARESIARFIQAIGFQPIILHERANEGRTVIEKVEAHGHVGFAVVLLTPDDEGRAAGGTLAPRARQNVLLELGYFIGRLGRPRVCALKRGDLEIPSDFGGVVYETFDASGGWKQALGRELEAADYKIDWNKAMR